MRDLRDTVNAYWLLSQFKSRAMTTRNYWPMWCSAKLLDIGHAIMAVRQQEFNEPSA